MSTINSKKEPAYTDLDLMPFGKHKGEPMQDVPAHYLRWWWNEDGKSFSTTGPIPSNKSIQEKIKLANYIWNSRSALEEELNDTFI
jgi:hypothetical protein